MKTCLDGTQCKVRIGNYLSSSFPIENGLKQGDALTPLLFNFALEYAIRKVIKSRRLRWAGHVARMEEDRSASKNLTGKSTRNRYSGRPRRRWKDNIRMDL